MKRRMQSWLYPSISSKRRFFFHAGNKAYTSEYVRQSPILSMASSLSQLCCWADATCIPWPFLCCLFLSSRKTRNPQGLFFLSPSSDAANPLNPLVGGWRRKTSFTRIYVGLKDKEQAPCMVIQNPSVKSFSFTFLFFDDREIDSTYTW